MPTSEPFLRITQVSVHLNTPIPTIREWVRSGKMQYYKPGKSLLFLLSDVQAFMALYRRRSDAQIELDNQQKKKELDAFTKKAGNK
jgi:excisionase family DNA binding protein